MSNQDWSRLGDEIKDAVQSAIDSKDYTRLNESIRNTVNQALDQFEQVLDGTEEGSSAYRRTADDGERNQNRGSERKSGSYREQNRTRGYTGYTREIKKQRSREENPFQVYSDRYASPVGALVTGILFTIFGGIMAAGCGIAEFVMLLVGAAMFSWNLPPGMPIAMGIMVPFIAGGGFLACCGQKKLGLIKRYKKYVACLGEKEYCELEDMEYSSGQSGKKLLKDLRKMIDKGWFRQGHLDQQETSLIVTDQAYGQYLEAQKEYRRRQLEVQRNQEAAVSQKEKGQEKEKEAPDGDPAGKGGEKLQLPGEVQEVITEGRGYLKQIKDSNDAIPGVEISEKISRLELVIERIFNRVEQHPELVEELRRFMKYYLPTTVKLLKAYEELDRQEIQGPNILKSKGEIEDTLDTINKAFENLLDSFFEDTAVDISSDISVMQTLMTQEGLLGSSLKERTKEKEKVLR
ncbi:MAG: 5-bromo-4-chloroindolyl phosphate hydrolysis family protein [Lachnospiraceae bacterium]|nr:5-bromo-4-chloroindolyl phosphate hydrolysis family protein [Lachnospiraceae bacterium]